MTSPRPRLLASGLVLLGAFAALYGAVAAPERAWPSLLVGGFYLASLAVAAMFFQAVLRLTSARWATGLRRVADAFMLVMPVAAALLLSILLVPSARNVLYPWSRPGAFADAPAIAGKVLYLQVPFVLTRATVVLGAWVLFAWLFRRASLRLDRARELEASLAWDRRLDRTAAVFVVVFALTFTVAAYDWLISLDPSWFSTMFAVYVFAGTFVQGIAAVTLATVVLAERGFLGVTDRQLHDLGKLLFAFSTFWAYIWTCQYLLIWYSNIPEEVTHHLTRTRGPWLPLFAANFAVNWVVPFAVLLSAAAKRRPTVLRAVAMLLLAGHWLDLYLLVMPAVWPAPRLGPLEVAIAAGHGALAFLLFARQLGRAPLVPVPDPVLAVEAGAP